MTANSETVKMFKAFSDERRLEILELLQERKRCAKELMEELDIGQSTLSHHMKVLTDSGVVVLQKHKNFVYYSISEEGSNQVKDILGAITKIKGYKPKDKNQYTKEAVLDAFEQGYDCCQVVFHYWAKRLGMDEELAYKVSTGFGAGMFQGETCGAVIGAYMALGLKYGFSEPGEKGEEQKVASIIKNTRFRAKLLEKYPSTMCRELLGADFSTREGAKLIREKQMMNTFCPQLVSDVIGILEELMNDEK